LKTLDEPTQKKNLFFLEKEEEKIPAWKLEIANARNKPNQINDKNQKKQEIKQETNQWETPHPPTQTPTKVHV